MARTGRVALMVCLVAGLFPACAEAASLRGDTAQGRKAAVELDPAGRVSQIVIGWKAQCDKRGTLVNSTETNPRGKPANAVRSNGAYRLRVGKDVLSVRGRLRARRVTPYAWEGTFRVSAVIRRGGTFVGRCRMKTTRWRASLPRVDYTLTSDPGDYQLRGESRSYSNLTTRLNVVTSPSSIAAETPDGSVGISIRNSLTPLRPGRYRSTPTGGKPYIDLRVGNGLTCAAAETDLTVLSSSFDFRRNQLKSIRLAFTRRCDSSAALVRGSLTFVR